MPSPDRDVSATWAEVLGSHGGRIEAAQRLFRALPTAPRCKLCLAPFGLPFGPIMRLIGFGRWEHNPAICTACIKKVAHRPGGSEIELSLLFADVRDSTALAENLRAAEFSERMGRFYRTTARAVDDADGIVDKVMGDGIMALFVPGITGPDHASHAIRAGRDLLGRGDEHGLPVGVGVHTGIAYVGVIGEDEATLDFTALGDTVNTAARLGSLAAAGELLVSDETMHRADASNEGLEHRLLDAKGKREPVGAWVIAPHPGG